jgi:hypothetical protein
METLEQIAPSRETMSPCLRPNAKDTSLLSRYWLSVVLLLATFAFCVPTMPSADMWWHLSTGRYILQNHTIPHTEPFSATVNGTPWTAHEWLSELIFYYAYSWVGSAGLLLFASFVVTLAFWFAHLRSGGPAFSKIGALALGVWATIPIFSVRPQIFTYLLASAFLFLLCRFWQDGAYQWLVPLPVLMIFWVNAHGGYALGLTLIALFATGAIADWLVIHEDLAITKRRLGLLCLACVACLLVVPLNPNGFAMYTLPFATLKDWGNQNDIYEWQSPDFHLAIFRPLAELMFLTVAALALSPKRPRPSQVLLFIFFSLTALYSMRNLPFFVLVAFPLLGEFAALPDWKRPAWSSSLKRTLQAAAVLVIAALCAKIGSERVVTEIQREQTRFPARAVSFLDAQKLPAPLFNSYDFGGYLIWRLYPRYRVYIDGRTELYGHTFLNNFIQVYQADIDPRAALDHDHIRTVLVEPGSGLAGFLRKQNDWKRVYEDRVAAIFTR